MIVWVRLHFKPSGLRCEMTVTPLEWVLGHDMITMHKDSRELVWTWDNCQQYAHISWLPLESLTHLVSPWPFVQWEINIISPFPIGLTQKKFLLVVTDYFIKWVKTETFTIIKNKDVIRFLWKNVIFHFGIPQVTISDNGPQFDSFNYRKFCAELGIKNLYSSPCYPQANGQAKTMIKSLLDTLKKRLQRVDEPWVEELPKVLWVYQTTR